MKRLTHNALKKYPNLRRRDNNEGAAVVEHLSGNSRITTYRVQSNDDHIRGNRYGKWLTFAEIQKDYTLE